MAGMHGIVPGDVPRSARDSLKERGNETVANPMHEFRTQLVREPVTRMIDELEDEARGEKLLVNKMQMGRAAELQNAKQGDLDSAVQAAELDHAKRVMQLRQAQDLTLRRVQREINDKTCEEAERYDDAVRRRNVVRHNVDAYFAHSRHTLDTALTARRSQVVHKYGEMTTTTTKQFELDKVNWDSIGQQVEIHITALRGLKDKIEEGEYVVLVSKYSKLGGDPFKWSHRSTTDPSSPPPCPMHTLADPLEVRKKCEVCQGWLGCTTPVVHSGKPEAVELSVDTSVFTSLPPRARIKPYSAFIFELLKMPTEPGETAKTVGWGAFPVTNGQFTVVKGKFRTPIIRGTMDCRVEHYTKMNQIISDDIEAWLGNLYFEVVPYPRECDGRGEFDIEAAINARKLGLTERESGLDLSGQNHTTLANVLAAQRGRAVVVSARKTNLEGMNLGPAEETVKKSDIPNWMGGTKNENSWAARASRSVRRSLAHMPAFGAASPQLSHEGSEADGERTPQNTPPPGRGTSPPPVGILKSTAILSQSALSAAPESSAGEPSNTGTEPMAYNDNDVDDDGDVDSNDASEAADSDNEMLLAGAMNDTDEARILFDMIDTNKDGVLSKMELYQFLSDHPEVKERLGVDSVATWIAEVDDDADGMIDRDEFATAWAMQASSATDILGREPSRMRSHSFAMEKSESFIFKETSFMRDTSDTFAGDTQLAMSGNAGGGTLFSKIREVGKTGAQKRKVAIERGEKWSAYTSCVADSIDEGQASWTLQLQYCWRGIIDELHPLSAPLQWRSWLNFKFWYILFVVLLCLYLQLYIHGMGIYVGARLLRLPTSSIDPTLYGLLIQYDGNFTYAFQELFICLTAMLANVFLVGLLIAFANAIQFLTESLPDQLSRFVYCMCLSYFFSPFLSLLIDHLDGHTPGAARHSDILRLVEFYESNQYEPFFGILTFAVLYLNISAMLCVMVYHFTMHVHMNGVLQDCFWRINVAGDTTWFVPLDLEVSFMELEYAAKVAEKWRGRNGERRKTKVSAIITTDEGDKDYISRQMHIVIYQLDCHKADSKGNVPKSVYREFYVLADGCIVEARKSRKPRAIASDAAEAKPTDMAAVLSLLKRKSVM